MILMKFWSPDCSACRLIAPAIKYLASTLDFEVWSVQAEENAEAMACYSVTMLPTLILIDGDHEVARHVGNAPYAVLEKFVVDNVVGADVVSTV